MCVKPAQGELNIALKPVFAHIPQARLTQDNLIVAAKAQEDHDQTILQVMLAISRAGLTLNSAKCQFGKKEISF